MKTTKNNSLRVASITVASLLGFALLATSCQKSGDSSSTIDSSQVSSVKPPQVDIHTAVITGNMDALKQHIAAGSNLNERDPFGGSSPLISAAVFGKNDAAKLLIDAGADINFQNNDGSTALISSAFFCRLEILKMLLEKGADKSIKNKYGASAIESVSIPFADAKPSYDMMGKMLEPMGMKLDYAYIEKTRPEIVELLK